MAGSTDKTESEKRESLIKIVKDSRTAFFVTETDGAMHGRPMANAQVEAGLESIWFATQRKSGKISELRHDEKVLLGYTNSSGSEWASVSGTAAVVDDRAKIKELWNPMWKNWFEGPDDPNIILICVTPHDAEYWDSGSRAFQLLKFAVTAATGKKLSEGENEKVAL